MTTFENVTIVKKANIYFDGKVTSRTVQFPNGTTKTLGFMQIGEYTFSTEAKELIEILAGQLDVLLPETEKWQTINAGEAFEVTANTQFKINIKEPTDYCCTYFNEDE
jgi:uncharacterized protein YaiE (UPF0345 family)